MTLSEAYALHMAVLDTVTHAVMPLTHRRALNYMISCHAPTMGDHALVCHSCTLPNAAQDPEEFPCEVLQGTAKFIIGRACKVSWNGQNHDRKRKNFEDDD